jgi:hypothetical protein
MTAVSFPFQERVITEQTELKNKIEKLEMFLESSIFMTLSKAEQGRLKRQLTYMELYHNVLQERIEEFDNLNEYSE